MHIRTFLAWLCSHFCERSHLAYLAVLFTHSRDNFGLFIFLRETFAYLPSSLAGCNADPLRCRSCDTLCRRLTIMAHFFPALFAKAVQILGQ